MSYGERFFIALRHALLPALVMTLMHQIAFLSFTRPAAHKLETGAVMALVCAYFFILWSIVGISIGMRVGSWRAVLKASFWCGVLGALGFLLVRAMLEALWMFAFFFWWSAMWIAMGAILKFFLKERSSHAVGLCFLGSVLSFLPFSIAIVMMVLSSPISTNPVSYAIWWGLSFYIPLVFLLSAHQPAATKADC